MSLNFFQIFILLSLVQGAVYITLLAAIKSLRTKANFFLAFLILALVCNLGQYWLRDVGLISDQSLQLIYLPWQVLVAPLFLIYLRSLRVFNMTKPPHILLWGPVCILVMGHLIIKGYLLVSHNSGEVYPQWIEIFNRAEEYLSMAYSAIVAIAIYKTIRKQKLLSNYEGYGVNQNIIKGILVIINISIGLCVIWLISLLLFDADSISNYYLLWMVLAIALNVLGLNGIYNRLRQGPVTFASIPVIKSERAGAHHSSDVEIQPPLMVATPSKYFEQDLVDALITLSYRLSRCKNDQELDQTFKIWVNQEFEIEGIAIARDLAPADLQGIVISPGQLQELTIPFRNTDGQLGSFTVRAREEERLHQRHIYYFKMAAKAYSFYQSELGRTVVKVQANNDHFTALLHLMKNEKRFLDASIDLRLLAEEIGISQGYLSKIVNDITGFNFNDWLNRFRVNYAKQLMSDNNYNHFSIAGYGYEAGFNSKSTFYKSFAKVVGQSPGKYKKSLSQTAMNVARQMCLG